MFRPFSIRPSSGLKWWTKEEITMLQSTYINSMIWLSSPCQTWWWPYRKGPKHVYLLIPHTLIKFCCVLTYPPYINLIFDIVIAHNGYELPKDCPFEKFLDKVNDKLQRRWRQKTMCGKTVSFISMEIKKVKQSLHRPGQAMRVPYFKTNGTYRW